MSVLSPFWLELTRVCVKWKETKASSHTIVFQNNAKERIQLKDESLAVYFNLICLSWVASRPCQGEEAVEPVEYLLGFVLWKLIQCSAVHGLYQMAHEEYVEMQAMLSGFLLNA